MAVTANPSKDISDISDTHFEDIQMLVPIIQQNVVPVGLLEQFFNDDVVAFIVNMSNLQVNKDKGKHKFKMNASEICLFVSLLLLTVYNSLLEESFTGKIHQMFSMPLNVKPHVSQSL